MLKIVILCSSKEHPIYPRLLAWRERNRTSHEIRIVHKPGDIRDSGDLLFLISCADVISREQRAEFAKVLVIHASDLPIGRGWSPHIWQILSGADMLTVTLLEAEDKVDTGNIWKKVAVNITPDQLYDEINQVVFDAELRLMDYAVEHFNKIEPRPQTSQVAATYYRKRTPEDSRVDPERTIAEQFDLIRVCDPERYPAFFDLRGSRYIVKLEKVKDDK